MDIELNTLLVALMFVTILSMGIGNILGSLADILNHATSSRRDRLHIGWIVLVLLTHFNLFWNTKAILDNSDWKFGGFLLAIAGPVLLFFSTSVLLTTPEGKDEEDLRRFYRRLGRPFFLLFALVQGWILFTAFALEGRFIALDVVNASLLVLALYLSSFAGERGHVVGLALAWALALLSLVLRWLAVFG